MTGKHLRKLGIKNLKNLLASITLAALLIGAFPIGEAKAQIVGVPIALHPINPHYFLFRDQPTALVTSGEHYGALLNLDFDYETYFATLESHGFNLTRMWAGTYREVPGSFNITQNTMAPVTPDRYITPWARTTIPGTAANGNKFDLNTWDQAYFDRLHALMQSASNHGIVVEFTFFSVIYDDGIWSVSPQNPANNINGLSGVTSQNVHTLNNAGMLAHQDAVVAKLVTELQPYDNVYFEIVNEPYVSRYASDDWQNHIISVIENTESTLPNKHLIAQNYGNGTVTVSNPNPATDIFNFHYAYLPTSVANNYHYNKPLSDDETGFDGVADLPYRREGWSFMLAGGAVYSNLDYSFTANNEDGTFAYPGNTPGGGGVTLRNQLQIMKNFLYGFDFVNMAPANGVIKGGLPSGVAPRVLAKIGEAYGVYLNGGTQTNLVMEFPTGIYKAEWVNTKTGNVDKTEFFNQAVLGNKTLASPAYTEDIALRVTVEATGDTVAPTVAITSPLQGAQVARRSTVTIQATSSDDIAVTKVEFRVNNTLICTDTVAPYTCVWNTPNKSGTQTLNARAYDAYGNTGNDTITVTSR
jgi:hypothetical protein